MVFKAPLFLWLILPLVFLLFLINQKSKKIVYPYSALIETQKKSLRVFFAFLTPLFLVVSGLFLILALARPSWGMLQEEKPKEGIAIEMVVDHSGSMGIKTDLQGNKNRLDSVKIVFDQFIEARKTDLVGLITFARFAETLAPLTANYQTLREFNSAIELVTKKEEDGTSIGDALMLAAARLKKLEAGDRRIKSRIVILLTDGKSNTGNYSPLEAAQKAKEWGVKVFPIGFGQNGYTIENTIIGRQKIPLGSTIDQQTLKEIASLTGGEFFLAQDEKDLDKVLNRIDSLEKSNYSTKETPPLKDRYPVFLFLALLFFLLAWLIEIFYIPRVDI